VPPDREIRVAYFPDSFHEVNGVAHTSRQFEGFARRRGLPFLCVRAGTRSQLVQNEGSIRSLEFPRGRLAIPLEKDLKFDPVWLKNFPAILREVRAFRPDMIHVTGPSEPGLVGACVARRLRLPLAASWHTNLHEYAAARSRWFLGGLPASQAADGARCIEELALRVTTRFYRRAQVLFAPNPELCAMLERRAGRKCHLMQRGIDAELFSPERRSRDAGDAERILGFVGRLSPEKNVRLLAQVQRELETAGVRDFRFRIVGQGSEEAWLRQHLPRAEFTGVLRGEALARAYAGMDVFVFPSHTETFGNVVLEALASGVPAVVTPDGGPRSLVRDGRTGFITPDQGFPSAIARLLRDPALRAQMGREARAYALSASWDAVFETVCAAYRSALPPNAMGERSELVLAD
jgi:phosphatidylinositol alpha 1,6-mannosyltransferase